MIKRICRWLDKTYVPKGQHPELADPYFDWRWKKL